MRERHSLDGTIRSFSPVILLLWDCERRVKSLLRNKELYLVSSLFHWHSLKWSNQSLHGDLVARAYAPDRSQATLRDPQLLQVGPGSTFTWTWEPSTTWSWTALYFQVMNWISVCLRHCQSASWQTVIALLWCGFCSPNIICQIATPEMKNI